jgi:hypothetical protein
MRFIALNMLATGGTRKFQINHNSSLPFYGSKLISETTGTTPVRPWLWPAFLPRDRQPF